RRRRRVDRVQARTDHFALAARRDDRAARDAECGVDRLRSLALWLLLGRLRHRRQRLRGDLELLRLARREQRVLRRRRPDEDLLVLEQVPLARALLADDRLLPREQRVEARQRKREPARALRRSREVGLEVVELELRGGADQ